MLVTLGLYLLIPLRLGKVRYLGTYYKSRNKLVKGKR